MPHFRIWILIAVFLFGVGLILGLTTSGGAPGTVYEGIIALEELADILASLPLPLIAVVIFIKNVISLLISLIFSPILCLVPVIALVFNGWIIGLVSNIVISEESLGFLLAGLLPHGIIEIPAFILGQAVALNSGAMVIFTLFHRQSSSQLGPILKRNLKYLAVAIVLLIPAAIIETYVTPLLLK